LWCSSFNFDLNIAVFAYLFYPDASCRVGAHKKNEKHERSFFPPFWWRKEALFVLFEPKKVVSGSLFGCFAERERERERVGTKNTLIKSLEERKKELLIERTKRNARTTRKRRKRKRKRRTKRFLRFL
jgi:hypothetical protein